MWPSNQHISTVLQFEIDVREKYWWNARFWLFILLVNSKKVIQGFWTNCCSLWVIFIFLLKPCRLEHCGKNRKNHDPAAQGKADWKNSSILVWYFFSSIIHLFTSFRFQAEPPGYMSNLGSMSTQSEGKILSKNHPPYAGCIQIFFKPQQILGLLYTHLYTDMYIYHMYICLIW